MLLEHQAAMKLARKLAQKIGAEPEKFGEMARKAAQAPEGQACGLNYGPIPIGAAGKALNFMHYAVNGVRPYPEEGGRRTPESRSDPCAEDHDCNGESDYDATKCGRGGEYEVCSCDSEAGYGGPGPCISPDLFICGGGYRCQASGGPFKCTRTQHFTCDESGGKKFSCDSVYWQWDRSCPTGDEFGCPHFICDATYQTPFGCESFSCQSTYGCEGVKDCEAPMVYGCPAELKYNCQDSFTCELFAPCDSDHFECHSPGGFDCGLGYNS